MATPIDLEKALGKLLEGAGKGAFETSLKSLKNLVNKNRIGFTTSQPLANSLYYINKLDRFNRLKECVGKGHWALNLIRIGIYLSELNEQGQKDVIAQIKDEVYAKEGHRGIKILNIGTTHAINGVIEYLRNLKLAENWTQNELSNELNRIILEWEAITIFVKNEEFIGNVETAIKEKLRLNPPLFFVFAYGLTAKAIATKAIADLRNQGLLRENNYLIDAKDRLDTNQIVVYSCSFKLTQIRV